MQLLLASYVICLLFPILPTIASASNDNQPQILSKNGGLALQSVRDKNIHLRLNQGSSLIFNDTDILEKIHQLYTYEDKSTTFSRKSVSDEVHKLREGISRLVQRFSHFENNTRNTLKMRVMRQFLRRLNRLTMRLSVIEENVSQNECTDGPCKNGGTCYDLYKGYHCECPDGWQGKSCEEDVDECYLLAGTDLGCQNNAVCTNTPGSYRCTCAKGFSGTHCRLSNTQCQLFQSAEFCGHGTCIPANNQHGYTCLCDQGWSTNTTLATNSTASLVCDVDIDECEETKNPCHNECINLPGSFKCGPCPAGYTGDGMNCYDIDECDSNNGGCSSSPLVRCINTEGSYVCGKCPPGWIGDGRSCDLAPSNSCDAEKICHPQAKCEYISNIATCTCAHGMFGHGFGPEGCHTNPMTDSCENHICQNNGTCLAMGRSTRCMCPLGYSGALCETKDACHPNPCENEGTCKALGDESYKCSCPRGTTGKHCEVLRSVCSSIQRKPSGELSYPADGATEYAPLERCAWIIRTLPNRILRLNFLTFDVEPDPECSRDWLQIHDGNSLAAQLIGRFCGNELPLNGTILSSHNVLFFWFRSDNATQRSGFHMNWTSQMYVCGVTLEVAIGETSVIRSPGYPGNVAAHRDCQWKFTAPMGYRFHLRIYDIEMGNSPNCTGDSLKIYDANLISKEYCQTTTPQTLRTSSNELKLKLHTDGYGSDTSFQLHFEVESSIPHCGGVFTAASGIILGPSEPSICLYSIRQPLNMQVKITFAEINLSDEENCNLHSIEIFDGKTDEDSRLLIACGGSVLPPSVVSSGNSVLIRYMNKFPNKDLKSPFKIKYTQDCEFRYFGPDSGIITTPNYPNPFTEHITCTYHIYGPAETMVLANFTDISLPPTGGLDNAANDAVAMQNDTLTYFEVHLSDTNRQCFYKAASPMELYSELNKMTIVFHATSNAARARGLRIEYSFEETECGGVYTEPSGIFMKGIHDGICKYIFEASEDKHIHLSFTHYTLMDTKLSTEIYGRMPGEKNVLLKNISSSNQSVNETFHFNAITVIPDLSVFLFGGTYEFVNNTEACGGNYVALYGVIKSPNWPRLYSPKLDCVWTISARMGYKIELRVQNFTLEPECTGDILEIRNGKFPDSPLIGRYCGLEIPSRIPSFGNSLYLRFTTDSTVEAPGFHIIWEQMETGCGGKLTSHKGSIHSPLVATSEEIGVKCDWLIHVAEGSGIQLKLTYLTNPEDFCRRNNLRIYQGSTTSKPFDNQPCLKPMEKNEELFLSSDNQMLVVYTPFNVGEDYTDFVIDYGTYCKTVLDHVQGIIESPNFPEPYPELLDCRWDIKAGTNNHIKLAFSHFSLETTDMECENDYVEVWDMKDEDILKKYHLCSRPNDVITSEGNQLRVRLVTDYSNNKNGFRAEYTRVGCGEVLTNEFGTIASPNYPFSGGLECEWYIEVPAGKQIVFTVTECQGDYEHVNCSLDSITVKESKTSPYTLMHYCISQQPITNIYSPMNRLYVQYQAGPSRGRKFFKAMYHTRDATCGGVLRVTSGWLYSPSYPRNTTEELSCKWDISVADANVIYLTIKELEFNQSENCEDNYLKIAEVSSERTVTNVSKICSLDRGLFMLNSSRVTIEYKNQKSLYGSRFMLLYRSMCGGKLEMDSGLIVAASNEDCFWTLSVAKGNSISLNILELDCFCSKTENGTKSCGTRGLGLSTNNEHPQTYTDLICEHFQSHMMFESTQLYIYTNRVNFRATYSTTQHSCGGTITTARGILTSPNYPLPYAGNIECIWTITAKLGNTLQIEFDDLDMASSEHCNEDFLEIRSWLGSKALAIYCGNAVPEEILKSKDSMWLKFRSSEGSSGKGFKLKWSYAHLTEYVNETRGLIESPPTSLLRNEDETFAWRILVPRQQFVALYFKTYLDGLKLYDGYDSTALPIEISDAPWRFVSSSNVVYFETDTENSNYFQISWNTTNVTVVDSNVTTSKCHVDRLIKPHASVMIYSPNYPSKYDNNLACDWIFKPFLSTQHVVCEVYEVKLENVSACASDYLKISTSSDLVQWHEEAKLCDSPDKTYTPYRIYNGTPNLKLDFVTDVSIKGKGFAARIITKCGSNLTQSVGFIEGEKLLYETDCHWRIRVRPGKRILLQFDFAPAIVKNPPECLDYVLIYDGIDRHAPLLPPGKLCNPQNVSQIQMNSSSNYLAIQYKLALPRPIMSRRWNLTYREYSTCNEEYRLIPEADIINITSPNYPNVPPPRTECEWRVMAPRGELIDIKFSNDFHMNTKYCDLEYVELFDGATALAKSLGKYCRTPPPMKTTQNLLYIHYLTDVSEPRAGFKVQLSIGKCGGTFTASSEIITSPGYPQPGAYPAHSECDYVISQPADTRIRLILLNINLPFNHNFPKSKDYLEIIPIIPAEVNETIPSVFVFGNATRGTQIDLNVNRAIIRFHTSARATLYHGFQIKYNRFSGQCHQEMEGVSGPITLNFPRRSFYSSYCRWKITVPKGLRVRLEFLNMGDFEVQNESRSISFTIYNDHEMQSKILTFDMNSYDPNTIIQSSDNTMLVSIYIPTMTMPYRSLKAHYYSDSESFCPPNIDETSHEGRIDIGDWQPNFQQPYYCKAKINLNPSETLVFNISRFELKTLGGMPRVVNPLSFRDNLVIASYRENLTQVLHPQSQPVGFWQIVQTDYERIVRLSMSYRRHACGGNYVVRDGLTIEQPDIRDLNYGAIMCVWSLNRPYYYGRTDAAFRLVGNFTFNDSCEREFILIKEQSWQTDAVKKICRGEDTSLDYNLKHSRSFVVYQAESYVNSKTQFHFEAKKTIVCGSETMVTFASTRVEVDRQTYRNNEECLWIFKAQRGFYLQVTFYGRFFVEHSENCSRDYVEIQRKEDGLWIPDVRYCGRDLPPIYNSSTNQIQIIFRTNENVTADGFSLFVRSHCSLVVNVTSSEVKTIYRPQNLPYRNLRTQCEYIFQSNEKDKLIKVRATSAAATFSYRRSSNQGVCFMVYKRDTQPATKHCELEFEERAYNYLRLTTNENGEYSLEYSFDTCGGNVTNSHQIIRPQKHEHLDVYANNMNCVWYVTAPADHSIVVRFKYFNMEERRDHLSVYSGHAILGEKRVTQLSGNLMDTLPTIIVDHNQAVINAISDSVIAASGFEGQIVFIPNCNERISLTDGNSPVSLARNYATSRDGKEYMCLYRINAPNGYRIRTDIKKLDINDALSNCSSAENGQCTNDSSACNFVEVFDSVEVKQPSMGKFCNAANTTLFSSYNDAMLKLIGAQERSYSFEIILTMEKSECGTTDVYTLGVDERYTITMPQNHEATYNPNVHCTWRFKISRPVLLGFNYIDLQNVSQISGECLDYIRVNRYYNFHQLCGHSSSYLGYEWGVIDKKFEITFHSDATEEAKGFQLVIEPISVCGQTYSHPNGLLDYLYSVKNCQTNVTVAENTNLNFYIWDIMFGDPNEGKHYKIVDLKTNTTVFHRSEDILKPVAVFLNTSTVQIEAVNVTFGLVFYSISQRTSIPGCGGTYTLHRGLIISPNYENERMFTNCTWIIQVPAPNSVKIKFLDFNMGTIANCHLDYLQMYDIMPDGSEQPLKTLCGPNTPREIIKSLSNVVRLISKTTPNFDGSGWSLSYNIV